MIKRANNDVDDAMLISDLQQMSLPDVINVLDVIGDVEQQYYRALGSPLHLVKEDDKKKPLEDRYLFFHNFRLCVEDYLIDTYGRHAEDD